MTDSEPDISQISAESENKKRDRTQAKRSFTRYANNLRKSLEGNILQETVKSRFKDLKKAWVDLQTKYDQFFTSRNSRYWEKLDLWSQWEGSH